MAIQFREYNRTTSEVSTGSGSDRVAIHGTVESDRVTTRSLPLPVLTASSSQSQPKRPTVFARTSLARSVKVNLPSAISINYETGPVKKSLRCFRCCHAAVSVAGAGIYESSVALRQTHAGNDYHAFGSYAAHNFVGVGAAGRSSFH